MVEIIILAMVFLFVGLRLWSVLGRRTGHEQQPIAKPVEVQAPAAGISRTTTEALPQPASAEPAIDARATDGIRAIAAADNGFEAARFLQGAQSAYRMVLEAYWKGDVAELDRLADDGVRDAFREAIEQRRAAGHVLDNRLITIERAEIERAALVGQTASITVRFDADIAAVTRDAEGTAVAGSLTDAVQTHDVWTFSRNVRSDDPNWMLVETDEAA
ncbi:Tim44/TimA family putative adaptor protein [Sphingomonas solaris]|uniref:Tim44 domain-containing protein n=1 Tax=Alterirhizorhabdus solaris TaxID=2529389 RepID=A0A558QZN1_9SPHN|nr:Tim44/TimA family putative adaptor protein [Sphingomonas solaris]TVV72586.1 Tim44 domain-containing protein [Sphingomonas solaris]